MTGSKSLWASIQGDPTFMRRVNGWFTIFRIATIPLSIVFGLLDKLHTSRQGRYRALSAYARLKVIRLNRVYSQQIWGTLLLQPSDSLVGLRGTLAGPACPGATAPAPACGGSAAL